MNIKSSHTTDKPISASVIFKGEGKATALQILRNEKLKEHSTSVPALLLCVEGEVVFENEQGLQETLQRGDMIHIEPQVKHWVRSTEDSQLLLLQ